MTLVRMDRLDLVLAQRPWPFAVKKRGEIEAFFNEQRRINPALWNGQVLLLHDYAIHDAVFQGAYFQTDFASMLAWRDWGFPDDSVRNCFAQGALRTADGAFLMGVMGAHTANAGKIYFPSGTPDLNDVVGDSVDLDASVMRELNEETGIEAGEVQPLPGWHAVFAGPRIGMMKVLQSAVPAAALRARILDALAAQAAPELSDIRVVRGPADLDPMMPGFVTAFLAKIWT